MRCKLKKVLKILVVILISFISLIVIAGFVFYRSDLPLSTLEEDYFNENSYYLNIEIMDLNYQPVTIDIHYQDLGNPSDPVVILLHGMFASSHTFEPWMHRLHLDGYRVISIDLPNHGLSGQFSDNTISQRRSAAVVKAILDHLHITSGIIGGNSMGGGVSWYFASEYHLNGFNVEGLILIDAVYPTLGSTPGGNRGLIQTILRSPLKHLLSKMTPKFLLQAILNQVYGSANRPSEDSVQRYYQLLRRSGHRLAIVNSQLEGEEGISGPERLEIIRQANIPTLVMWGREDRWIAVDYADLFQDTLALSQEHVIIYETLGHVPMEEDPDLTYLDLIVFLQTIRP